MIRYGGVVLMMLWFGAAHAQLSAVEGEAAQGCPDDLCRALIICSHHQMPSYAAGPHNDADFEPGFGKCAAIRNQFERNNADSPEARRETHDGPAMSFINDFAARMAR